METRIKKLLLFLSVVLAMSCTTKYTYEVDDFSGTSYWVFERDRWGKVTQQAIVRKEEALAAIENLKDNRHYMDSLNTALQNE
jgi:uncharacterized protein (UPF0333 family)